MQVINRFRLRDFWTEHPRSEHALRSWFQLISSHDWGSPDELQATFPNVELHESLAGFSIEGGSCYVIASIDYQRARLFIRDVQLHTRFQSGEWKQLVDPGSGESDAAGSTYAALVDGFPLRPIRDDEHFREAADRIDSLLRQPERTRDEQDYLDVLALIAAEYERREVPISPVSGNGVLRALITEHHLTMIEMIPLLGSKAKATAVMREGRPLDLRQVSRASRYFKLPPEAFMDPDDLEPEDAPRAAKRR